MALLGRSPIRPSALLGWIRVYHGCRQVSIRPGIVRGRHPKNLAEFQDRGYRKDPGSLLSVTPAVDHYNLRTWRNESGSRTGHQTRLDGGASTLDFSKLYGGDSLTGYVAFSLEAYYNTGEVRGVVLDTTFTSDSPYIDVSFAGKFTNGGATTPDCTTTFKLHPEVTHATSAKLTIKRADFTHTLTLTNLPQG